MLFQTWPFILFFLIVYPIYLILKNTRFKTPWLLAASYFFYATFNPLYLILIAYATVVDYTVVLKMSRSTHRKMWLFVSIANNLLLLCFFKYAGFVTENINHVLSSIGSGLLLSEPNYPLPVGISFYTLQSMSYTIDYYRGNTERETSLIRYAAFVSLFPQLVAGPIERARHLLPQLRQTPDISINDIADGLSLFVVGFFKKVALADYFALYVDKIYGSPGQYQTPALVLATFLFAWQIYFDFSGYTDMARGLGRMLGFRLMLNFNNPYLATGLRDFWSRWHISLSTWFRDYVYIPMGGNRKGSFNTYRNIFLTMIISGFWHGAAWTFLIWGLIHATGFLCTRELERTAFYKEKIPKIARQMFVFVFVTFAWIFFRSESMSQAWTVLKGIFNFTFTNPYCPVLALVFIFAVWIYQFVYESRIRQVLELRAVRFGIISFMIFYLVVFAPSSTRPFIYFQF